VRQHARRLNLEDARRAAESWIASGPTETRPRIAYTRILLRLGQVARADSVAKLVATRPTSRVETSNFANDRMEIALKTGDYAAAARIADSLHAETDTIPSARILGLLLQGIMGHPQALRAATETITAPDWVKRYFALQALAMIGLTSDSVFDAEQALARAVAGSGGPSAGAIATEGSLVWIDPRVRGDRWGMTDTASGDPRIALVSVLATRDTVRFRRMLMHYDSIGLIAGEEPDNGLALAGAYGHLVIADTAGALRWLRTFRDSTWLRSTQLESMAQGFAFQGLLWPRTFLLLGDLAAATGQRDEAVQAYRRFVGMWDKGDPEVQPMVQRARAALARLGG